MTTPFQPGQHPDADQLNAFAEHTLPLHEQHATLAHLATCPDCRAIVYLAQPPAPEPHSHPAHTRTPLFARWMLAFPAAAALVCLILLTIHVRNRGSNQIAVPPTAHIETPPPPPAAPPEPAAQPASAPAPVRTPPAATVPASRTPPPAAVAASPRGTPPPVSFGYASAPKPEFATTPISPEKKTGLGGMSGASYVPPPALSPPPAAASPAVPVSPTTPQPSLADRAEARRELRSAATQYDMPRAQTQKAAPAGSATNNGNSGIYGGTGQTNLNENYAAGVSASNAALQGGSSPVATTAADAAVDQDPASARTTASPQAKAKALPALPSNLSAVSVATSSQHQLALDTAGALFRSDDAGVTWQAVPVQWTGHAVSVALVPSPNLHPFAKSINGLTNPPAAAKSAAAPTARATFQLTTDAGDLWISPDGQTWNRK